MAGEVIPADFNPVIRRVYNDAAVANYCAVKSALTLAGSFLEDALRSVVGGRQGGPNEPDILTPLGAFEVRTGGNTKNSKADEGDRKRLADYGDRAFVVQVFGLKRHRTKDGVRYISAEDFLVMHGLPISLDAIIDTAADRLQEHLQEAA